ncbi:MAG: flagellar hook-basal body complex protein FliE [Planctomycetota bacterium]|nr:flagellar hook-basal body complex protein FliE [Planctomycetota bacterium]
MVEPLHISGIGESGKAPSAPGGAGISPAGGEEFRRFLLDNLNRINEMQREADQAVEDLASGKETDITRVMGAVEKADVAFQTLMAVRNKLVEAYQEILRMRI